eukprot:g9759.t1
MVMRIGLILALCVCINNLVAFATEEQHKYKNHYNIKCKAGQYEALYNTKTRSKCEFPITSEKECKKAAQFNKANGIDKNNGYGGATDTTADPYGCFHNKGFNDKYFFNYHKESPTRCSKNEKSCLCDHVSCQPCQRNTYGDDGKTCKTCPTNRPMSGEGSKHVGYCREFTCPPGYEKDTGVKTSGRCKNVVTFEECRQLANTRRRLDKNPGFDGRHLSTNHDIGTTT